MGRLFFRVMVAMAGALVALTLAKTPSHAADEDKGTSFQDNCLTLFLIKRSEVVDDNTILFYMSGNRIKKMTLAFGCPSLKFYESFSYETRTGTLCARIDSIVSRNGAHCPIAEITDYQPPSDRQAK